MGQWRRARLALSTAASDSSKTGGEEKSATDPELDKKLDEEMKRLAQKLKEGAEMEQPIPDMETIREMRARKRAIFTWKSSGITLAVTGVLLAVLVYVREKTRKEEEKQRRMALGKARIGGEWQLLNTSGELEGSKQLKGNWLLIYFGFTHCPDICPDEIEKMIKVVDILDSTSELQHVPIIPVFISVDPERDTVERVKKYCGEFSPKLRGYTGSKEQTDKVTHIFRVYHSQGPRTAAMPDDYIVDHTVIMYLMDPDGNFHDYYGQNRKADEIANVIRMKVLQFQRASK